MQWLDFVNKLLTCWYSYFLPTWSAQEWCKRVLWNVLIGWVLVDM